MQSDKGSPPRSSLCCSVSYILHFFKVSAPDIGCVHSDDAQTPVRSTWLSRILLEPLTSRCRRKWMSRKRGASIFHRKSEPRPLAESAQAPRPGGDDRNHVGIESERGPLYLRIQRFVDSRRALRQMRQS